MENQGKWVVCAGDLLVDMIVPYGEMKRHLRSLANKEDPNGAKPYPYRRPGGTSGNTAVILAQLGVPVIIAARVSAESNGKYLMEDLKKYNINTRFVIQEGPDTVLMIGVLDDDDRVMFTWRDPSVPYDLLKRGDLGAELTDHTEVAYISGVNVLAQGQQGVELVEYAERCKRKGARVAFDLNLRVETFGLESERKNLIERMVRASDIVFGSGADEFGALTGKADFGEALFSFAEQYPQKIVVGRDGARPACLLADGRKNLFKPLDVRVVNKVGAGDAFNAGFLAAYWKGLDLRTAMKYGTACACYAISHEEARGTPNSTQLKKMVEEQGKG